jgi:hypothetical protein
VGSHVVVDKCREGRKEETWPTTLLLTWLLRALPQLLQRDQSQGIVFLNYSHTVLLGSGWVRSFKQCHVVLRIVRCLVFTTCKGTHSGGAMRAAPTRESKVRNPLRACLFFCVVLPCVIRGLANLLSTEFCQMYKAFFVRFQVLTAASMKWLSSGLLHCVVW